MKFSHFWESITKKKSVPDFYGQNFNFGPEKMRQLFFIIFRLNVHDFFVGLNEISQLPINHFFGGIPVSRQGKNEKIFDEYKMWWKNVFETRMKKPIRGINKFIITFCAQCSLSMKWNAWMQMQKVGFSWSLDRATVTQLNFIQVFELKSVFFWESENIFFRSKCTEIVPFAISKCECWYFSGFRN